RSRSAEQMLRARMPEILHNVAIDGVADVASSSNRSRKGALLGQPDRPVESHKARQARVEILSAIRTEFPDCLIPLAPVGAYPLDQARDISPRIIRNDYLSGTSRKERQ